MKRLLSIATPVAVIAAAAIVTASGDASIAGRTSTMRVDFKMTSVKIVDAEPKGDSAGDFGVVVGDLMSHANGKKIGRYQGTCFTMTSASNSECTFTWSLPAGQITTISAYGKGFNGEDVVHDAVVGGTHAYRNARGEGIGRETGDGTGTQTFHLTR
ncbi:MAG: Dirigent-like protein [bacterium]|jgi:hypothetical protein